MTNIWDRSESKKRGSKKKKEVSQSLDVRK